MIGAKEAIAVSEIQRQLTTFHISETAHSLAFDRVFTVLLLLLQHLPEKWHTELNSS